MMLINHLQGLGGSLAKARDDIVIWGSQRLRGKTTIYLDVKEYYVSRTDSHSSQNDTSYVASAPAKPDRVIALSVLSVIIIY